MYKPSRRRTDHQTFRPMFRSGTTTCAIHVGQELLAASRDFFYRRATAHVAASRGRCNSRALLCLCLRSTSLLSAFAVTSGAGCATGGHCPCVGELVATRTSAVSREKETRLRIYCILRFNSTVHTQATTHQVSATVVRCFSPAHCSLPCFPRNWE